jgi:hypothetical protein
MYSGTDIYLHTLCCSTPSCLCLVLGYCKLEHRNNVRILSLLLTLSRSLSHSVLLHVTFTIQHGVGSVYRIRFFW